MASFKVVLDANVLIPAAPRDTLLRAAEAGLIQLHWSDAILAEVERNLVENGLTDPLRTRRLVQLLDRVFPDANVSGYEHLIEKLTNDPRDRHVLAAAIHARAQVIVTQNLSDFPESALGPYGIEAYSIDHILTSLFSLTPSTMTRIMHQQANDLEHPPLTVLEVLDQIARTAPTFARRMRRTLTSG